jgi:hypothetical protein
LPGAGPGQAGRDSKEPDVSRRARGWHKLAGAASSAPSDPQFDGDLEIDAGSSLLGGPPLGPGSDLGALPLLVLAGAVRERPVAIAWTVVARPTLTLTATFHHRHVDDSQAASFAQAVLEYRVVSRRYQP